MTTDNDGLYVLGNDLCRHGRKGAIETFSSHWAAVAAMIRLRDPDFKSSKWDPDKPEDLAKEEGLAGRL